jgi:hypothetical protein
MVRIPHGQSGNQAARLVGLKYPATRWEREVRASAQSSGLGAYNAQLLEAEKQRLEYFASLRELPEEKVIELIRAELDRDDAERPFHRPQAAADYDHWLRCETWSAEEAVALSFGKDPLWVSWDIVEPFLGHSAFAEVYWKRRDLVSRAIGFLELTDPMSPRNFLGWARKHNLELPEPLASFAASDDAGAIYKDLYERLKVQQQKERIDWENERRDLHRRIEAFEAAQSLDEPEKPLETRERENLQATALLGAIRAYGFDPDKRNSASREMSEDLDRLGMPFSDDRIKHHLDQAAERLRPKWREQLKPRTGRK